MEYEGPGSTKLTLLKKIDGELTLVVTNHNWSAKKGTRYEVDLLLNGKGYGGGAALGYEDGIYKGFLLGVEQAFEADFASGRSLHVYLGETRIDQLSLAGTTVALASVNRCLDLLREEMAAETRERQRWQHLPADPFKDNAGQLPVSAKPPKYIGKSEQRVVENYPVRALREGLEGTVAFVVRVSKEGRAIDCTITESSGHAILDKAACDDVQRYGRFEPATDENGNAVEGMLSSSVSYALN